jgi:hypothetical protein
MRRIRAGVLGMSLLLTFAFAASAADATQAAAMTILRQR